MASKGEKERPKRRGSLDAAPENGRRKPAGANATAQSVNGESKRDNELNAESLKENENQASNSGDAKSVLKKDKNDTQKPAAKKRESHND